jgi:hypothetical protein
VGAIDGTHVLARVPKRHRPAFMCRKHTATQNVLAVVDFDLRFTYVLSWLMLWKELMVLGYHQVLPFAFTYQPWSFKSSHF